MCINNNLDTGIMFVRVVQEIYSLSICYCNTCIFVCYSGLWNTIDGRSRKNFCDRTPVSEAGCDIGCGYPPLLQETRLRAGGSLHG